MSLFANGFIGGSKSESSSKYIELEYIESSGTQYIDTGFAPDNNTRIVLDLYFPSDEAGWLFGSRNTSTTGQFGVVSPSGTTVYRSDYGSEQVNISENMTSRFILDKNKNVTYIDEVAKATSAETTFQTNYSIYLFNLNNAGSSSTGSSAKLYACQIYDNETLVRDFVPCINMYGQIGLWDKVTDSFFGNAGTGAFTGKVKNSFLPNGYTRLEYLESSGTQYIDTGINPTQDTRIVTDIDLSQLSGYAPLFGGRTSAGKTDFSCWVIGNTKYQDGYGSSYESNTVSSTLGRHIIEKNKNQFIVDGSIVNTWTSSSFSSPYSAYLFNINTAGNKTGSYKTYAKMYSCQIYDDSSIVRDFIPCSNPEGTLGLYDGVNGVFYENAGTGNFISKLDLPTGYTQLEYIESSGTQYIDTGFIPNQDTRVVIDVYNESTSSTWIFGSRQNNLVNTYGVPVLSTTTIRSDYNTTTATATLTSVVGRLVIDKNKNITTINTTSVSHTYAEFSCPYSLYLLKVNHNGSASGTGITGKIYSCQIYDNDVLVRNFVPCIDASGTIGLYDLVSGSLFTNAGTGTFTAGSEV